MYYIKLILKVFKMTCKYS